MSKVVRTVSYIEGRFSETFGCNRIYGRGEHGRQALCGQGARLVLLLATVSVLLAACGRGEDVAGYPVSLGAPPQPTPSLPPVSFPRDEAPHGDLTEWWYYTGHLQAGKRRYGFELVTFQAVRGQLPRSYVAHFAITDQQRRRFAYDQRLHTGPQPVQGPGFNLEVGGWKMSGAGGTDRLQARMPDYGIDLTLRATKPAVLHEGDGIISFGPAGTSYYYSRTRMSVQGTIEDHGKRLPVTGQAWMDHQWGNFISVAGGGWDWYSIQLEDGADLTVSEVRNLEGEVLLEYGTYVEPNGSASNLDTEQVDTKVTARWRSPKTGAVYPSGWRMIIRDRELDLTLTPVLPDQELDTRKSTGVAYWEGAVEVAGTSDGKPIRGKGYVELTGYAKTKP